MLTLYWFCFAVGGVFVALAVIGGVDHLDGGIDHLDTDLAPHPDLDVDISAPADRGLNVFSSYFKFGFAVVRSFKFWTFGLCFFGLTGLVLSRITPGFSTVLIAAIAGVVGCILGSFMAGMLQFLWLRQVNSMVRTEDLVGLTGIVEIPLDASQRGKVRLQVKGSNVAFMAYTDEIQRLEAGDTVLVVGMEDNRLWVVAEHRNSENSATSTNLA